MFQNVTLADNGTCNYSPGESSVLWWDSLGGINPEEVLSPLTLLFTYSFM